MGNLLIFLNVLKNSFAYIKSSLVCQDFTQLVSWLVSPSGFYLLSPVILSCDWLVTSTGKILIGQEMQAGPDFVKRTKHNNLINLL